MKYDPGKHHRRSICLKGYDYASAGMWFITICTYQRQCLFGEISGGEMQLSKIGEIAESCWQAIPDHFPKVQLDQFVVMPNHLHGIISTADTCRGMALPCPYPTIRPEERRFGKPIAGSLSTIVGSFKSVATKQINLLRKAPGTPAWQRNYYEHIVRNEASLQYLRQYIQNNPLSWQEDQLHPDVPSKW
ncbi:MAG: transposase [Stenomitos rutilans HA7619-LM2]|nr:transposase [Stenomitos rutilans HA7619-LM2]